jgi:hypothetical protein
MKNLSSIAQQWLDEPQASVDVYTAGPVVPERTNWLSDLASPWTSFGKDLSAAAAATAAAAYDDLPVRLFDWGMDKLGGSQKRTVSQGAGVTTTYIQPAKSGGAPAAPNYTVPRPVAQQSSGLLVPIPTTTAMPKAAGLSSFALVVIGLVIYLAAKK